jgi:hypothetical protein
MASSMPSSRPELIPAVVNLVMQLQPRSILEIGTGFGKYGFLFREYLEIWGAAEDTERLDPSMWQVRIDGIEFYEPYVTDVQRKIYDNLIVGDAMTEIDALGGYDLIFMGEVIEHFPKEDGRVLIEKCRAHANQMIVISTPNYLSHQGAVYGNDRETHHCLWTCEELRRYPGGHCFLISGRYNLGIIPTPEPATAAAQAVESAIERWRRRLDAQEAVDAGEHDETVGWRRRLMDWSRAARPSRSSAKDR